MTTFTSLARAWFLIAASAVALAGCDTPRIDYTWASTGYTFGDVSYAADHRDMRVDVVGAPRELAGPIAALMPNGFGIVTHFTATPGPTAHPLYRVVWEFGPSGYSAETCARAASPVMPAAAPSASIAVAYCRGPSTMSGVAGHLARPADPNDPVFQALVRDMTLALFPRSRAGYAG